LSDALYERLWDNIDGPWTDGVEWDDCWLWRGAWRSRYGYGRIAKPGHSAGSIQAHRLAFEQLFGPIAEGHIACHACANPRCCNPFHIVPGTYSMNNTHYEDIEVMWLRTPLGYVPPAWHWAIEAETA
jgi:hypothetical protein